MWGKSKCAINFDFLNARSHRVVPIRESKPELSTSGEDLVSGLFRTNLQFFSAAFRENLHDFNVFQAHCCKLEHKTVRIYFELEFEILSVVQTSDFSKTS